MKKLYIKNQKMTIHSVSMLLYVKEKGFVICEEMRKGFPDTTKRELKTHFIGGKVEGGESPLLCGCRELCEEVPIDYDYQAIFREIEKSVHKYIDITVSVEKNLENRFYFVCVDSIKNQEIKSLLENIVDNFDKENSQLVSLSYWDGVSELDNTTNLIEKYMSECALTKEEIDIFSSHNNDVDEMEQLLSNTKI